MLAGSRHLYKQFLAPLDDARVFVRRQVDGETNAPGSRPAVSDSLAVAMTALRCISFGNHEGTGAFSVYGNRDSRQTQLNIFLSRPESAWEIAPVSKKKTPKSLLEWQWTS
jgi:hypothetical protein